MAQRIYIASDQLLVSNLCTLLERAGISALMQKAVVDVPQGESGPVAWYSELWILRDRQLAKAGDLLEQALSGDTPAEITGLRPVAGRLPSSLPPPAEIA